MAELAQIKDRLGQRFSALTPLLHASQAVKDTWIDAFLRHYTEPHRHYHDLTHIDAMFVCYDGLSIDDETILLAIIFHDWVYDPLRKDNELESAKVFDSFAEDTGIPTGVKQIVRGLIEATITHALHNEDESTKLFLDFDLEVLSRPSSAYGVYAKQIREEYRNFDDEAYRKGRTSVLENFLKREKIYFSNAFAAREHKARENIHAEILDLKNVTGMC